MAAPMTAEQANAVYDVLVKYAGANNDDRREFVDAHTKRFIGRWLIATSALGLHGKFLRSDDHMSVDAGWTSVWQNQGLVEVINTTNAALAALKNGIAA